MNTYPLRFLKQMPELYFKYYELRDVIPAAKKVIRIWRGAHEPIYASIDVTNYCNLKCKHCYWWVNRRESDELSAEQWRYLIRNYLKRLHLLSVLLAGGEPMLRPDVIQVFAEEMRKKFSIVTNATFPIRHFGAQNVWVSIDGPEEIHDEIRGKNTYLLARKHSEEFVNKFGKERLGISFTINTLNYRYLEQVVNEWKPLVSYMNVHFHTPLSYEDPLWLPYGPERDKTLKTISRLMKKYPGLLLASEKQLEILKGPWGGIGRTPIGCPYWTLLALDHLGRIKSPCFLGAAGKDTIKPICERCGAFPSRLYSIGIRNKHSSADHPYIVCPQE